jgi:RNA polymerase sigma-70 factor, ECF subfamily
MGLSSLSVADLTRRCRSGDSKAWGELVRRMTPLVYRLSYRMLRNTSEAEDAAQEAFLRAYRFFKTYDPTRPLEPWLSHVTYNVCLQRLNKLKRQPAPGKAEMEEGRVESGMSPVLPGPEAGVASAEEAALLTSAMDELSAQDRAILHMHYWEGFTTSEVSEMTDMPVNTVKIRMFRARGKLRKFLALSLQGA